MRHWHGLLIAGLALVAWGAQDALGGASSEDKIWEAHGTFTPTAEYGGSVACHSFGG